MAKHGSVTTSTAASVCYTATGPQTVIVANTGATAVSLGGAAVTAATGLPVAAGVQSQPIRLAPSETLYVIAASGTPTVQFIATGPGA
jgi:hypothetical protein